MSTSVRAHRIRLALAATAVATTTVLAGCSLGPFGGRDPGDAKAPARQHRSFEVSAAGYAPISATFPARPIAVRPTDTQGVTFELYQVKRSSKVATVVFALHNTGTKGVPIRDAALGLDGSPSVIGLNTSRVSLVDPAGLKEYLTFLTDPKDPGSACLCSVTDDVVAPDKRTLGAGERRYYANEVAAPPASVTSVTVQAGVAAVPGVRIED